MMSVLVLALVLDKIEVLGARASYRLPNARALLIIGYIKCYYRLFDIMPLRWLLNNKSFLSLIHL